MFCDDIIFDDNTGHSIYLSEKLEKDQPFKKANGPLNLLFPVGYRHLVFPMIRVTEIDIKKRDGNTAKYYTKTQKRIPTNFKMLSMPS
jgi:hypothetical protein